jgi:hypothetical protein
MFYHLHLAVWAAEMLELVGELYVELQDVVRHGKVPDMDEWQKLRRDGRVTGSVKVRIRYVDPKLDKPRPSVARATGREETADYAFQEEDFKVW